jgi:hypothetical protein
MRKIYLVLFFNSLFAGFYSQTQKFCGTDEFTARLLDAHPEIKLNYLKQQQEAKANDSLGRLFGYSGKTMTATPVYTIPIVFHILHQYGPENISDAQVIDQVNLLNRDYRKQNPDTINIFAPFTAADVRFEFRLATKDTNGNCTNGIVRHYDSNTNNWTGTPPQYAYTWNSSKYLNVYVVKQINGFGSGGYSSFPGTNTNAMDVIIFMSNSVGSIGTSIPFRSRLLTHEVGHWFDLHHIWGDVQCGTTCGDDGVSDTPITKGWMSCPSSPSVSAICNSTISENFQNYMDYSFCNKMFTAGQVARMTSAINSTVSGRNNLWNNSNLVATGVVNASPCAPIADLISNCYTVCSGGTITFNDVSSNGTVTSRNWSATGGAVISNSTSSTTNITFPTQGTQTVTLLVSNSTGSTSASKIITVLSALANINTNYPESFENTGLPLNFNIINSDNDVTWTQTSLAAGSGTNSYFINGSIDAPYSNPDILVTPSYDFSADTSASFTFKYAYAKKNSSNVDIFKVQVSSNCGGTWVNVYQPTNTFMATSSGGVSNNPFFPTPGQFVTYTLSNHPNFSSFLGQSNVMIRFYFKEDSTSGYGNSIFLDDINFNSVNVAGINGLSKSIGFNLFPNPSSAELYIKFTLSDNSRVSFFITDIQGRRIETERSFDLPQGTHMYSLNSSKNLNPGIYFLMFEINGQRISRKLVIN